MQGAPQRENQFSPLNTLEGNASASGPAASEKIEDVAPQREHIETVATSPADSGVSKYSASDRVALMAIVFGWIAVVAIINPLGEFVLNDDWAYSYAVKSILQNGRFKLSEWGGPNLFSQAYWGALFCLPFGFSYTALRFSTITIALGGLLALYGLLKEAGARATVALFAVLILALNPLFLELSFTYMTDVPFLGFTLIGMYLLVRGVTRQSRMDLALGLFTATAALLVRQTGLALFLALSLTYLAKYRLTRSNLLKAAAIALLGLSVQFSYQTWLKMTGRMTSTFGKTAMAALDFRSTTMSNAAKHMVSEPVFALMYLGLFVLPLLFFIGYGGWRELWQQHKSIAILSSVMLFAGAAVQPLGRRRLPQVGNVLYDFGLGPNTLRDDLHTLPSLGPAFWKTVTAISLVAAAVILLVVIAAVLRVVRARDRHLELLLMVIATGAIYFGPLPFVPYVMDRYYLPLVPLATVTLFVICQGKVRSRRWVALGALCVATYGAFAIAGTHDYLASNRVRWQALRTLTVARQIRPEQIDGGFEFNMTTYLADYKQAPGDDFLLAFGPAAGYVVTERYVFRRWLPPGEGAVLVLRKISKASY